ncbi:hypothetical protein DRQ36_04445 [bacterium]|nr:MAG: hypothetical protein DRQ36_04445 [bacterium]
MTKIAINTDEIRKIVREEMQNTVRELVEEQFRLRMMELRLSLVPYVSDKEQKEIEEMFGKEPGLKGIEKRGDKPGQTH